MNGLARRGRFVRGAGSIALIVAVGGLVAPKAAHAEGDVTYDVRQQVTGVLLPSRDFAVTGSCATGTGLAPASVYAPGGSGRGSGLGVGIGGRVAYQDATSAPQGRSASWWGFRVGAGLDIALLYAKVPTGIPDMTGKLCARVKSDGAEVQYAGSSVLLLQIPVFVGAMLGLGTGAEKEIWRGIVLGAAWAPTLTYLKPWVATDSLDASFLGMELTLDFATVRRDSGHEAGKRAALFLLLPARQNGPAVLTLSFGAVW
jgi:hypothetical protein